MMFSFTKAISVTFAVLCVTAVQSHSAILFQIGSIATAPNPTPGNFANVWPSSGGETPINAVDGVNTTKYLNFGRENSGYMITPAAGSSIATGLFLVTGNDSPGRDPLTFSLYGSNTVTATSAAGTIFDLQNTATFTPIVLNASTNLTTDPGRGASPATQPVFTNTTAFVTYVLFFPTTRDVSVPTVSGNNSMQIAEARLTGVVGGTPGTITSANDNIGGGEVIPEPSTLGLLGLTTVGLAALGRRR